MDALITGRLHVANPCDLKHKMEGAETKHIDRPPHRRQAPKQAHCDSMPPDSLWLVIDNDCWIQRKGVFQRFQHVDCYATCMI